MVSSLKGFPGIITTPSTSTRWDKKKKFTQEHTHTWTHVHTYVCGLITVLDIIIGVRGLFAKEMRKT